MADITNQTNEPDMPVEPNATEEPTTATESVVATEPVTAEEPTVAVGPDAAEDFADYDQKSGGFDRTLLELWAGTGVAGLVGWAVVFLVERKVYFTIGWWYGIVLSLFMAWHMWRSLDKGLDLGDGAGQYLSKANILRYVIVAVAYIALAMLDFGSPVAAFVGVLMLKVAAYIQPFTHKVFKKLFGWVDVFPPGIPDEEEQGEDEALQKNKSTDNF